MLCSRSLLQRSTKLDKSFQSSFLKEANRNFNDYFFEVVKLMGIQFVVLRILNANSTLSAFSENKHTLYESFILRTNYSIYISF